MSSMLGSLLLVLVVVASFSNLCGATTRKLLVGNDIGAGKVIGFVACDACLERNFTKNTVLLPGVTVSVTCKDGNGDPFFSSIERTDKHGRFFVNIPEQLANSEASHITTLCSSAVVNNPVPSCSIPLTSSLGSSLVPYAMQNGHKIFTSGPFIYSPRQAHNSCPAAAAAAAAAQDASDPFASEKAGSNNPQFTFPTNQLPGASTFRFPNLPTTPSLPNIPSSPASQFPVSSLFPPFPSNAPPLFPQFPPLGSGSSGSGFPQFPPLGSGGGGSLPNNGFQFPFFLSPPPGKK